MSSLGVQRFDSVTTIVVVTSLLLLVPNDLGILTAQPTLARAKAHLRAPLSVAGSKKRPRQRRRG